ncbi:MAG: hypothetical protein J5827_00050 [Oscillospiraceae bacterium]|nr:hypothetical protein [Oscillospiraceae bacterium]
MGKKICDAADKLTGALIGLARATEGNERLITAATDSLIIEGLFRTLNGANLDDAGVEDISGRIEEEKKRLVGRCYTCSRPCGRNDPYDMDKLWSADKEIRSLKSLMLFAVRGMAAYAFRAAALGRSDGTVNCFFYKALFALGSEQTAEQLLLLISEQGEAAAKCRELAAPA